MTIPKTTYTKPVVTPAKLPHPPKVQTHTSKPSTSGKPPPVHISILRKVFPPKPLSQQKQVRQSLVNPNLKISQTLPPLNLKSFSKKQPLVALCGGTGMSLCVGTFIPTIK